MKKSIKIVLIILLSLCIVWVLYHVVPKMLGICTHRATFSTSGCEGSTVCGECGEVLVAPIGHNYTPATYDKPATCSRCGATDGTPLNSNTDLQNVSKWGFYDLEDMGNCLVEITAYGRYGEDGMYVKATGFSYKFENGHMFRQGYTVEEGRCVFGNTNDPRQYHVADNDNIVIDNGWETMGIDERKTSDIKDNFVMFVFKAGASQLYVERWFVPYSLIDWDEIAQIETSQEGETTYILRIVP